MLIPSTMASMLNELRQRGEVRWTGSEFRTRCPAHADNGPSLYLRYVPATSSTLVRCGGGCQTELIVEALGLTMGDLFHDDDDLVEADPAIAPAGEARPRADQAGSPRPASDRITPPANPGDSDRRAEVYGRLLDGLTLTDAHRQDLRRRGLSDDEIDRRGYRSLERFPLRQAIGRLRGEYDDETLLQIPGFYPKDDRARFVDREGLIVPVRDADGRFVALKIRGDTKTGGPKYTWVSGASRGGPSPGSPPHIPLGIAARADEVRITEGELKADVASALSGLPTIGVPGVDQWRVALPILKAMSAKVAVVSFDMDAWTKPGVASALAECVRELARRGYKVRLETWDPANGKGIDDLLAAGKTPEVTEGAEALARIEEIGRSAAGPSAADDDSEDDAWFPASLEEEVAPFPIDCFPPDLARFATEGARALQCPVDFLGMAMLAVASAAIGNSRRLQIRRGYEEGARIFAAIVARAGAVKSPALRLACAPVYDHQRGLTAKYKQERQQFGKDMEDYEHARRLAMKSKAPTPPELERPDRPTSGHVYVENITIEALAKVLSQAPRGVLMIRDELTGWVLSLNQYRSGRGADRQVFLSIWSGEPTKIDRKGELDEPLIVTDPFVSVIGCIPPAKLATLDDGEDGEDGFIHRILFACPRPVTGRTWDWQGIRPEALRWWHDAVGALYALEMVEDEHGEPAPRVLTLAPEACPAWEAWYNAHLAETEQPDFPDWLVGPWSKLVSYAARLALIVHLLRAACDEDVPDEVDAESLARAFRLVDYFKAHARVVYGLLQRPAKKQGRLSKTLDWLRSHGRAEIKPSDLACHQVAGIRTQSEAEEVMKELADRGYGRLEQRTAKNHRKVTWFVTRPDRLGPVGASWASPPNWPGNANS